MENSGKPFHYTSGTCKPNEQFNMDSREETAFRLAEIVEFGDIRIGEWHDPTTLFHFEP